ncbi:hypothetical protein RIF29_28249 [Crotalaria pallida]|uniref:Uncharacterized protein n=1 Tax=Crotalaria pallida TaxID=3830 RepID=A0AAN9I381_CROPI
MKKVVTLIILTFCITFSQANPTTPPQPNNYFKLNQSIKQNGASSTCSYTATIKSSCTSTPSTKDQISLKFGDASGYELYVRTLDDPASRTSTFDRCSADTFPITGPCINQVCSLYLYRDGHDGWVPESVTLSGDNSLPITFSFNTGVPYAVCFALCDSLPLRDCYIVYTSDLTVFIQNGATTCFYTATIKSSCTSTPTEGQISLRFGDASGYEVSVPKLDTFDRCSADTFRITGPCIDQVCSLYLYRNGYDGWVLESVTVSGGNSLPITFYFNYNPYGVCRSKILSINEYTLASIEMVDSKLEDWRWVVKIVNGAAPRVASISSVEDGDRGWVAVFGRK